MTRPIRFNLRFEVIECLNCRATRERARSCPECGEKPDPREVDHATGSRQALVRDLRSMLERTESPEGRQCEADELLSTARDLLPAVLHGLQQALDLKDASRATDSLTMLVIWQEQVHTLKRRRPDIRLFDLLKEVDHRIRTVVDEVLGAFGAGIADAQRHSAKMQKSIDVAGTAVAQYHSLRTELDALRGNSVTELAGKALALELERTGLALGEYMPAVSEQVSRLLGIPDIGELVGDIAMMQVVGALAFDIDNYHAVLKLAWRTFDDSQALRRIIADSPSFLDDVTEALITLSLKTWGTGQALDRALSERAATEDLVSLCTALVDRPGALLARAVLLITGAKTQSYDKLRQGNGTTDIERVAKDDSLRPLVKFLNTHIRTAQAHDGVRYQPGFITTKSKSHGFETHELRDLIDLVLGSIESLHAAFSGLRLALMKAGFVVKDREIQEAMGVSAIDISVLGISIATGLDLAMHLEGNAVVIEAHGPHKPHLMTSLAHHFSILVPSALQVIVTLDDPDWGVRQLRGPIQQLRSWDPTQPDGLALLEAMVGFRVDDQVALQTGFGRSLAARVAVQALLDARNMPASFRQWGERLRRLSQLAHASGDAELVSIATECRRAARTGTYPEPLAETLRQWNNISTDGLP